MELNPVYSIETEQSILGCCLVAGCTHGIDPGAFYHDRHQTIARAIRAVDLEGAQPDLVTVADWLVGKSLLESVGGATYLAELAQMSSGNVVNLDTYNRIVLDYWLARKAQMESVCFLGGLSERKGKSYSEIVSAYSQRLMEISDGREREDRETPIKESCKRFVAQLEDRMDNGGAMQGISTGWSDYDRYTGGLLPGDLVVIAGRPSMGKTAVALNWIANTARRGTSSLVFSLEMSEQKLTQRIISRMARVESDKIRAGRLNASELERVYSSAGQVSELPVMIVDSPVNDLDIVIKSRRHKKQVVWVDYLGLIAPSEKNSNRAQELAGITRRLKLLAKELHVPVVLLAQLNRDIEKENRDPRLSDLRESGAIEQDADAILFVHVDRRQNKDADHSAGMRKMILAKQRDGDVGVWQMEFQRQYQHFQRLERMTA